MIFFFPPLAYFVWLFAKKETEQQYEDETIDMFLAETNIERLLTDKLYESSPTIYDCDEKERKYENDKRIEECKRQI